MRADPAEPVVALRLRSTAAASPCSGYDLIRSRYQAYDFFGVRFWVA
ncbi:UNVERIFIED_ORG: hypothetical protein CLV66_105211 [Actinomadura viridilutea]